MCEWIIPCCQSFQFLNISIGQPQTSVVSLALRDKKQVEQKWGEEMDLKWEKGSKHRKKCVHKRIQAPTSHPLIFPSSPLDICLHTSLPTCVSLSLIPSRLQPPLSLSASSLLSRCSKVFLCVWRDSEALVQTGYSSAQGQCTGQGGEGGEGGREERWTLYSPT